MVLSETHPYPGPFDCAQGRLPPSKGESITDRD